MTRFKEICKNIVIALLVISSLVLLVMALPASVVSRLPLPEALSGLLGLQQPPVVQTTQTSQLTPASQPLTISIRHQDGRHTIRRDPAALSAAYDALSLHLGKALANAKDGKILSEEDLTQALKTPGVLFTFPGDIPASALCRWLTGTEGSLAVYARDYLLLTEGNTVRLMTCGESYMQYETDLTAAGLTAALGDYIPDGSAYAGEKDTTLHPLTLWEQTVYLPTATAENPISDDFAQTLATELDFNPYGAGTYTDPQGNTVFTETSRTLSVAADGNILLTVTEPGLVRFTAKEDTPTAKIETTRAVLDIMTHDRLGEAKLLLSHCTDDTFRFTYVVGGVAMAPDVCTAKFDGVHLTELTVTLRSFYLTANRQQLMPLASAAAIAKDGARLQPAYSLAATMGWAE